MRFAVVLLAASFCQAQGRYTFRILCAPCHGINADGGRGPDLTLSTASDADLFRVIARGVPGTEMAAYAGRISDDDISRLVAYIKTVGNANKGPIGGNVAAGETIFWNKGACGQCHRVGIKGNSIGPNLTKVGRQRSVAYLTASIVKPDADVTPGFATVTVVTNDGKKITGVERNFDNFSAQMVDLSGKYYSFMREDVTSMKREPKSLMPSYAKTLSAAEVTDLVAYLNSLRGAQ